MAQNQSDTGKTSLQVSHSTRERIRKEGIKGQSYDEIVVGLLDELDELRSAKAELKEQVNNGEQQ